MEISKLQGTERNRKRVTTKGRLIQIEHERERNTKRKIQKTERETQKGRSRRQKDKQR